MKSTHQQLIEIQISISVKENYTSCPLADILQCLIGVDIFNENYRVFDVIAKGTVCCRDRQTDIHVGLLTRVGVTIRTGNASVDTSYRQY